MITLYIKPYCPYSRKAIRAAKELGVNARIKDIAEEENLNELLSMGGKRQVPFMVDSENDIQTYESDEIVKYLCKNFNGTTSDFEESVTHICDL